MRHWTQVIPLIYDSDLVRNTGRSGDRDDQRKQPLSCMRIAVFDLREYLRDFGHEGRIPSRSSRIQPRRLAGSCRKDIRGNTSKNVRLMGTKMIKVTQSAIQLWRYFFSSQNGKRCVSPFLFPTLHRRESGLKLDLYLRHVKNRFRN